MGEKELKDDISIDWEAEAEHYKKLYYELDQSSQNTEERLSDEIFKKDENIYKLQKEIKTLRKIMYELSELLNTNWTTLLWQKLKGDTNGNKN